MDKDRLVQLFNAEKLAEIIVRKDKEIERFKERDKDLEYVGKVFINGKYYLFYIREENEDWISKT